MLPAVDRFLKTNPGARFFTAALLHRYQLRKERLRTDMTLIFCYNDITDRPGSVSCCIYDNLIGSRAFGAGIHKEA
jgi:hypothetical protein